MSLSLHGFKQSILYTINDVACEAAWQSLKRITKGKYITPWSGWMYIYFASVLFTVENTTAKLKDNLLNRSHTHLHMGDQMCSAYERLTPDAATLNSSAMLFRAQCLGDNANLHVLTVNQPLVHQSVPLFWPRNAFVFCCGMRCSASFSIIFAATTLPPPFRLHNLASSRALSFICVDSGPSRTSINAVPNSLPQGPFILRDSLFPQRPIPSSSALRAKSNVSIQTGSTTCGIPALYGLSACPFSHQHHRALRNNSPGRFKETVGAPMMNRTNHILLPQHSRRLCLNPFHDPHHSGLNVPSQYSIYTILLPVP